MSASITKTSEGEDKGETVVALATPPYHALCVVSPANGPVRHVRMRARLWNWDSLLVSLLVSRPVERSPGLRPTREPRAPWLGADMRMGGGRDASDNEANLCKIAFASEFK